MEHEIIILVISIVAAFMSSAAVVGAAAWRISGQISALGGQIAALSARMDGMERHFDARLGRLETEVHGINEYLRRKPQ